MTTLLTLFLTIAGLQTLLVFILALAVVALLIYLIGYIPLGAPWQTVFRVIVAIAVIVWALNYFGVV